MKPTSATHPCRLSPTLALRPRELLKIARPPPQPVSKNPRNTTPSIVKMLYLVGLGLADEKDVTVRGLEIIKKAERVYLESYTAVLLVDKEVLVRLSPTPIADLRRC